MSVPGDARQQAAGQTHKLKCVPPFFAAVLDGSKPFEARKHDRPYAEGDTLVLREWNGSYTGRECERMIGYVLVGGEFGIERGYCVLGLRAPKDALDPGLLLVRVQEAERVVAAAKRLSQWEAVQIQPPIPASIINELDSALAAWAGGDVQEQETTTDSGDDPEGRRSGGVHTMARYRKRPVVIDAVQLTNETPDDEILAFLGDDPFEILGDHELVIHTLEGDMRADAGDWLIRGVKGELYPCKPDIFAATYEPASATPTVPVGTQEVS